MGPESTPRLRASGRRQAGRTSCWTDQALPSGSSPARRGGLITFKDNPRHRRARLLRLTPDGRAALALIQAAQAPWADALGGAVGIARLERANQVLDQVLASVAEAPGRDAG